MRTMAIELEKEEYTILPMFAHEGPVSLDAIATAFYGKTYCGQQTGEMISNDSHEVYNFTTDEDVQRYREEGEEQIQAWLELKIGDPNPSFWYEGQPITNETEIERAAPSPSVVMADLIRKGQLPMGKYLVRVWW